MDNSKWFQHSLCRILVDMHIHDWDEEFLSKFDPENYAKMMEIAGVDCAEVYGGSALGLCNWPSKIGYQHKNSAKKNIFKKTLDALKNKNIDTVLYLNVWNTTAYLNNPNWRTQPIDTNNDLSRCKVCCFNSPYRDYFLKLLHEFNSLHEGVGLWIDMIGWFHIVCYCPHCKKKFKEQFGHDYLPEKVDWDDPVWNDFFKFRRNTSTQFAQEVYDCVKNHTPDRSLTMQSTSWFHGWRGAMTDNFLSLNDYIAADIHGDQFSQSFACKILNRFSKNKPIEFMISRCEGLENHTTSRSKEELLLRGYSAIANQASFTLIDAIDPNGQLDENFYINAKEIFSKIKEYKDFINADSITSCDVAIYYNLESQMEFKEGCCSIQDHKSNLAISRLNNLTKTLLSEQLTYTFVGARSLDVLDSIKLLILPECTCLTSSECQSIRNFVARGGKLYASGASSMASEIGKWAENFQLADLFGVNYANDVSPALNFISLEKQFAKDNHISAPIISNNRQLKIVKASNSCEVLGTYCKAWSQNNEIEKFASILSNPPKEVTNQLALVRNRYQKGTVIYSNTSLELESSNLHCRFLGKIFKDLLENQQNVKIENANGVEITLFYQAQNRRYILSLLNFTSDRPPILHDINVTLKLPHKIKEISKAPNNEIITDLIFSEEQCLLKVDKLDKFAMYVIKI